MSNYELMQSNVNLLNFQGLISNRSGKEINIVSEQPQSEDCKDWNDVLVENHFNNKGSQQTKDYSNVIVSEKMNIQNHLSLKRIKRFTNNEIIT